MAEPTINSNVGVNLNSSGIDKAASKIASDVRKIVREIESAGKAAADQLKKMSNQMKDIQTLRTTQAKLTLGDTGQLATLGRQARALSEYRNGMNKTADSVGVLRHRLQALDVEFGKMAQKGRTPSRRDVLNAQNIEAAATSYGKVTTQVNSLRGRIAMLGEGSQKALAPMLTQLEELDTKNRGLFAQSNRYSFNRQVGQYEKITAELSQQVKLAEASEKRERRKLETLREEANQILTNNKLMREQALAQRVRQAGSFLNNMNVTGSKLYQRETDQVNRFTRATTLAASTKNRLDAEMAKPVPNPGRLDTLIQRYQKLQQEIAMSIAMQQRADRQQSTPSPPQQHRDALASSTASSLPSVECSAVRAETAPASVSVPLLAALVFMLL